MSETFDQIINHLEFIGYEVAKKENNFFIVTHPTHFDIFIEEFKIGVQFVSPFSINEEGQKNILAVYECMNLYNLRSKVTWLAFTKEYRMLVTALYPLCYEKTAFGIFMDVFNMDCGRMFSDEVGLSKYIK